MQVERFNSINSFLRNKFGDKVFKVTIDAGFSCPNRDGTVSNGGCIFCNERGSGDNCEDKAMSITDQFNAVKKRMSKKWKSGKYIAYLQAFTNTYKPVDELERIYNEAISQDGVVALAIATRPDCLSEEVLELLEKFSKKVYLWVELGLQTSNENSAKLINRGYTNYVFEEGVRKLQLRNIDVVSHVIFGLPGENNTDMINTIKYIVNIGVNGVKIHLLYLLRNTSMVKLYEEDKLKFLTQEEYTNLIVESIAFFPKNIVIHRITGDPPRKDLIGPKWSTDKWNVLNTITKTLNERNIMQGDNALY